MGGRRIRTDRSCVFVERFHDAGDCSVVAGAAGMIIGFGLAHLCALSGTALGTVQQKEMQNASGIYGSVAESVGEVGLFPSTDGAIKCSRTS